jgi:hypothetical protein
MNPTPERKPKTPTLATLATRATNPPRPGDVATLMDLCADLGVSPAVARASVSVAELAALTAGTAPEDVLTRFSQAIGKALARGKP